MKKWPKILYVKQTCVVDSKFSRVFTEVVKTSREESRFRATAAAMAPNFSHEISEKPFGE